MSTEVNIAIVCITENGKNLALKIQTLIIDSHVYIVSNKKNKLQLENESKNIFLVKEKLSVLTEKLFKDYQYILFIKGLFFAPSVVVSAVKTAVFASRILEKLGYIKKSEETEKKKSIFDFLKLK